jgi:hypothetical protein
LSSRRTHSRFRLDNGGTLRTRYTTAAEFAACCRRAALGGCLCANSGGYGECGNQHFGYWFSGYADPGILAASGRRYAARPWPRSGAATNKSWATDFLGTFWKSCQGVAVVAKQPSPPKQVQPRMRHRSGRVWVYRVERRPTLLRTRAVFPGPCANAGWRGHPFGLVVTSVKPRESPMRGGASRTVKSPALRAIRGLLQ